MDLGIAGKVALVTGGARSLGKQDCLTLAAEGCKLIILDLNGEGAAETANEIVGSGGTARVMPSTSRIARRSPRSFHGRRARWGPPTSA